MWARRRQDGLLLYGLPCGQNSSQGWVFSFVVLMVFAGGVWIKPQSVAVIQN